MSSKPYILHVTAGTPVTGLWCDTCLFPARFTVPLYVMGDDGPREIATMARCRNCQPEES